MTRKSVIALLSCLLILTLSTTAAAKVVIIDQDWSFEKLRDTAYAIDEYRGADVEVTVPSAYINGFVTTVNSHAFSSNDTLTTLTFDMPMEFIGDYICLNDTALQSVKLAQTTREIGEGAFSGTTALKSVNLEDTRISTVAPYTFMDAGIASLKLPDTCTEIARSAFAQCNNLVKAEIPNSVTAIDDEAFRGSDNVVIYADSTSYAIEYAKEHGIPYILTDMSYYMVGDADEDEEINIFDVTCIQRILADFVVEDAERSAIRGDVNGDGLDIFDATTIQRYIAGMTTPEGARIGEIAYYE